MDRKEKEGKEKKRKNDRDKVIRQFKAYTREGQQQMQWLAATCTMTCDSVLISANTEHNQVKIHYQI